MPERLLTPADTSTCCAAALPAQGQKQLIHFSAVWDNKYSSSAPCCDILLLEQIKSVAAQGFLRCSSLLSANIRWSGSLACFPTVLMRCSLNRFQFEFFPCLWLSLHLIQHSRYDRPYILPCGHNICWLPAKTGTGCMSYFHGCVTLVTHRLLVKSSYITDLLVLPVVWPALSSSVMRWGVGTGLFITQKIN